MEKAKEAPDKLGRFDRLVQSLRIEQRALDQIHDDLIVPLGVLSAKEDTRIVDHGLKLLVVDLQILAEPDLLHLSLAPFERVFRIAANRSVSNIVHHLDEGDSLGLRFVRL